MQDKYQKRIYENAHTTELKDARSVFSYSYNRSQTLQYTKQINIAKDITKFSANNVCFFKMWNNKTKLNVKTLAGAIKSYSSKYKKLPMPVKILQKLY